MISLRALGLCGLLAATPALAHIKLDAPADLLVTDTYGNPQKTEPCGGAGTPSNQVTTVEAGSKLTVTWHETIPHPGHFRIAIAPQASQLTTPTAVVQNNDCKSAAIQTSPVLPVVADGLFPHASSSAGTSYTTEITVPNITCTNCTLQLLQFMSSHAPPCFYFHCATLNIVPPADAGTGGGAGSDGGSGGGAGGGSGSDGGSGGGAAGGAGGAGGGSGGGVAGGAGGGTAGGGASDGGTDPTLVGGCGCGPSSNALGGGLFGLGVLAVLLQVLRRSRQRRWAAKVRAGSAARR